MEKIESFKIDHMRLKRGIYVSRKDGVGSKTVTTFDLRMKEPNNEQTLSPAAAHTIEHIGATFLRNHSEFGNKILYFGPMGCLTGFYLLLSDNFDSKTIVPLIQELFKYVAEYEGKIPGATPVECGNHTLMDLPGAKVEAERYFEEVLNGIDGENLVYPE
jgi:S-ribosylhomocysteine lyase